MSSKPLDKALADLKQKHDAATSASRRAHCRGRAREYAERLKVPVPAWAAMRMGDSRPKPAPCHGPPVLPFGKATRRVFDAAPAVPVEIPAPLRAWRERNRELGAIVRITRRGEEEQVELSALGSDVLRFASVAEAVAA